MNRPLPVTKEDFVLMQRTAQTVIECIFQRVDSFKNTFVEGKWGWTREDYTIQRVHLSGSFVRITVEFYDGSTTDAYLPLGEIYNWIIEESDL